MGTPDPPEPLIERLKAFRPRRAVRRGMIRVAFLLLTLVLFAEVLGACLRLAGLEVPLP